MNDKDLKTIAADWLRKYGIFVLTVILIASVMPRENMFSVNYEINKPWHSSRLMANFNFPVYKSDAVIKREHDSIMASFEPYFRKKNSAKSQAINKLLADKDKIPANIYGYLKNMINTVYDRGIVSTEDMSMLMNNSYFTFMIADGNQAITCNTSDVFSPKEAYEYIMNSDTLNFSKAQLQRLNINDYIIANYIFDKERTKLAQEELKQSISDAKGYVQSGEKIVDRGEIVTEEIASKIASYQRYLSEQDSSVNRNVMFCGHMLFTCLIIFCYCMYLNMYRPEYINNPRTTLLLTSGIFVFVLFTSIMMKFHILNVNMLPFVIVPLIIRVFLDSRTAFITHVVTIFICSGMLEYRYEFVIIQGLAGLVAIYSLRELEQRSQIVRSAFWVFVSYCLCFFSMQLIQIHDFTKMDIVMYENFIVNGFLVMLAYPLLYYLEKWFGFISNVTLIELSNVNNPILRKLSEEASGTFNHSMQVANLAAFVANKIGAKSQLVRTGALYHDIGKLSQPIFFTENQKEGQNPHDEINDCHMSAEIIIEHVTEGLKIADKYNVPEVIKDFIRTHHGNGIVKYFYITYKNAHPDEEVDIKDFTYPGPNPQTKEQAILMMVDSVEAASRSLKEFTDESISKLVEKIIDDQTNNGFFKECPITFKEIATAKSVLKEKLKSIYHLRVSYPELKKKRKHKKATT